MQLQCICVYNEAPGHFSADTFMITILSAQQSLMVHTYTHTHTLQLVIQYGYYRESFVTCPHVKDSDSCASVTLNLQYPYSCISPLLHTRGITLIQNSISPAIVLPDHEKINEICRQILVLC